MSAAAAFSLVYLLEGAAGLTAFAIIWRRRAAPGGRPLAFMLLAAAMWAIFDGIELYVPTIEGKRLSSQIQYLAVVSAAPFFFRAVWELSGHNRRLTPRMLIAVWGVPLISLVMAWTSPWHHWLWSEILPPANGSPFAIYRYGWWFWVLTAQNYVLMVAATVILLGAIRRVGRHFRRGMALVIVVVALPWLGNAAYNLKLGPWPGLNWLTLSIGVSGSLLAWIVRREGLLDLLPQARGAVLEIMSDVVLVIDREGHIIFLNQMAKEVIVRDNVSLTAAMGFPPLKEAPDLWHGEAHIGDRWFDVRVVPVPDRWGAVVGQLVVARDVTMQKELQHERERLIADLQNALGKVNQLEGMLPICANCRKIRDDGGYWAQIEDYLSSRTAVEFTHGICPDCLTQLYPEIANDAGSERPGEADGAGKVGTRH